MKGLVQFERKTAVFAVSCYDHNSAIAQGKFSAVLEPLTALALGCRGPIHVATVPTPGYPFHVSRFTPAHEPPTGSLSPREEGEGAL